MIISQKTAIYIRVSTQWQIDKDSLKVQKRELIAYSEMILGIKDYVIFEDPGYSAKNTDRPGFQTMMARLRTGEFSHLLVWKIDRISRNTLDFVEMYQELKRLGITFVSKNESFDTSTAIGEAMLKLIMIFAELERNMVSERVTAVMLSRAGNGQWNGGRIPYGYSYDKETKTFSENALEKQIYDLILNKYEETLSVISVSNYLNSKGIKTRGGSAWTATAIHKILRNPFYIGDYVYNVRVGNNTARRDEKEWVTIHDHHLPLIDADRFDKINFSLSRNKRGGNTLGETHVRTNVHIFAGLVRCGKCGSNMSSTPGKRRANGWKPSIYGCTKRRNNSDACDNKFISDITLGPFVFNYVANIIRAKNTTSERTSLDVLERKLLRGESFSEITHIDREGLRTLLDLFISGGTGLEYSPPKSEDEEFDELQFWEDKHRKDEIALNRLQSLYLYGDGSLTEKDFIIEKQKITKALEEDEAKILEVKGAGEELSDTGFLEKASYFIMVQKLLEDRYIDYEKYIRPLDPTIPRDFCRSIIRHITAVDGRVSEIEFSNGMIHKFIYKDHEAT